MKSTLLNGLVSVSVDGPARYRYIQKDCRYSADQLEILSKVKHLPTEHLQYIAGRLRATIADAEAAKLVDRAVFASMLLRVVDLAIEQRKQSPALQHLIKN